jgi:protein Tob/BTG
MKLELQSAANFLVHLIRLGRRNPAVNEQQLEKFRAAVVEVLRRRYRDHWFPEKPFKGSGYRCIRINGKMDPVIAQAAETCGLAANLIHSTFPSELTMWIDPLEVSYRIGENGSICVLYEHKANKKDTTTPEQPEAWRPTTSNSTSSTATVVVSNASGPGSGNNTVDNGSVQQQKRTPSPLSSPTKLKTTQQQHQQTTSSSSFSSPSSPFHNNQLNNHHHNLQQHNQSQQRFNNLNQQQNVNNKNAVNVNDLNQHMRVLGLKPSEASLLPTGSTMSNSGAVTNLASTNSQQEAHQQFCGPQDSLYKIDYLMDPRKSVSIEQLAAYVSS